MPKKYLDETGLQVVADSVNSRLKIVTELPENPREGQTVLYIGDSDPELVTNHTYSYKIDSSPDYYAYKTERYNFIYTTDENPTSESPLFTKNYYGEMSPFSAYSVSYDNDTFTVIDIEGQDPEYYSRDENYDVLNKTGWNDISDLPVYEYNQSFGQEMDWASVLMPHREPFFILTHNDQYAVTTYYCTFSPYLNYRRDNIWTAQSGSKMIIVVENGYGHEVTVDEINLSNPPIYNNLLIDDNSSSDSNFYGKCEIDTYRYIGAIYKYYDGYQNSNVAYIANNDEFTPIVDEEIFDFNGFSLGTITAVDNEEQTFTYTDFTGYAAEVSFSEMQKSFVKICINFDTILQWKTYNGSPDANGMRFQYVGSQPHPDFTFGHIYYCQYDVAEHSYTYTDITPSSGGGGGAAEDVTYSNASKPALTNVKLALDDLISKVYYVEPSITSFTMAPSTTEYEIGQSVSDIAFTWAYNKDMVSQTLTDCTLADETVRSATAAGPYTSNKTFTLSASDGENSTTQSKSISFKHKVYWGNAAQPGSFDSSFILGLTGKKFATNYKGTYSMNIGSGEYGFLCYPASWGTVSSWWIGGFEVTTTDCGTINFTNASGNTTSFRITRTSQPGLGSITAEVK